MKDVADTLARYAGPDRLKDLLADLEQGETAQGNLFWREYLRRIRRSAGLERPDAPPEPKALLDLIDRLEHEENV